MKRKLTALISALAVTAALVPSFVTVSAATTGSSDLGIVLEHIDYIGIDYEGNLCSTYPRKESNPRDLDNTGISRWYSKDEILNNNELYNFIVKQLSLPVDKQVEFGEINKILNRRTALLDLIGYLTNQDLIDGIQIPERQLENAIRKIIFTQIIH